MQQRKKRFRWPIAENDEMQLTIDEIQYPACEEFCPFVGQDSTVSHPF